MNCISVLTVVFCPNVTEAHTVDNEHDRSLRICSGNFSTFSSELHCNLFWGGMLLHSTFSSVKYTLRPAFKQIKR
jgi:hypothetical protein